MRRRSSAPPAGSQRLWPHDPPSTFVASELSDQSKLWGIEVGEGDRRSRSGVWEGEDAGEGTLSVDSVDDVRPVENLDVAERWPSILCERNGIGPLSADRGEFARYIPDLAHRPGQRGPNVVAIDSGVGLANATMQPRLVAVRLFYDHLVEEGLREQPGRPRPLPTGPRFRWSP